MFFAIKRVRNIEFKNEKKQQEIFTIWHVETFEGGGKARIDYLKRIAREMEKENNEVLFMIKQIDPRSLENEINSAAPDIISFGFGVGKIVLPHLQAQSETFDIRDELVESGSFNKSFYAVPFMVGGYAMFNHSALADEFHVGQNDYISPNEIYGNLNLTPKEIEGQYDLTDSEYSQEIIKDEEFSKNLRAEYERQKEERKKELEVLKKIKKEKKEFKKREKIEQRKIKLEAKRFKKEELRKNKIIEREKQKVEARIEEELMDDNLYPKTKNNKNI